MKLGIKRRLDYYLGGTLLFLLKPVVFSLGKVLRRDHRSEVRSQLAFIKMLGGGSLVIAYPSLLSLRKKYSNSEFILVTTSEIKPFAETLNVFDAILIIKDRSLWDMIRSSLAILRRIFRVDTIVDLEIYSRLTGVLSVLSCARNRIGFYFVSHFWKKYLYTHLLYFNQKSGIFLFYEHIAMLLGAEILAEEIGRQIFVSSLEAPKEPRLARTIGIGHSCSQLSPERMLQPEQWEFFFKTKIKPNENAICYFYGVSADRDMALRIASRLKPGYPLVRFENLCGKMPLKQSINHIASHVDEFWAIDSSLLHYARLIGIPTVSFWGPTDPQSLLSPRPNSKDEIYYKSVPCSPCVHVIDRPPCNGNNICMQSLFKKEPVSNFYWLD